MKISMGFYKIPMGLSRISIGFPWDDLPPPVPGFHDSPNPQNHPKALEAVEVVAPQAEQEWMWRPRWASCGTKCWMFFSWRKSWRMKRKVWHIIDNHEKLHVFWFRGRIMRYRTCIQYYNVCVFFRVFSSVCCLSCVCVCVCVCVSAFI